MKVGGKFSFSSQIIKPEWGHFWRIAREADGIKIKCSEKMSSRQGVEIINSLETFSKNKIDPQTNHITTASSIIITLHRIQS